MDAPFCNEPIPTDAIPTLAEDAFVSVDPRYLRASLAGTAVVAVVVVVVALGVASQADRPIVPLLVGAGLLVLLALIAILKVLEVRRLAYQLREHDLTLRSGVINHHVESLPFTRVQHVNVNRGPLERAFGLATLEVSSAGPNITIPGLTDADASRIKLLVTERAGVEAGEHDEPDDREADRAGATPSSPPPPSPPPPPPPPTSP